MLIKLVEVKKEEIGDLVSMTSKDPTPKSYGNEAIYC